MGFEKSGLASSKEVAQIGAAIGREFPHELLAGKRTEQGAVEGG
jgi:hypothetical protein